MLSINCRGRLLSLEQPLVMGIININNDSFHKNNRKPDAESAVAMAEKMLQEGAAIIDIGGQSTTPSSTLQSPEEEIRRVIPAIEAILKKFPETIISVDTFYAAVAAKALDSGAAIINDISGGMMDDKMCATVAEYKAPYILMHMKGTPQTMQSLAQYEDITKEVLEYFIERIDFCKKAGIHDIILDPGYGFAKTREQNFELLNQSQIFSILEKPVLTGISRKSMIYRTLENTAQEALNGTTVLNTIALMKGSNILRVHDVKEAVECIKLTQELQAQSSH